MGPLKNCVYVVLPCYNEEKNIGNLINSIKQQLSNNFQIIAVDDGSSDSTLEILKDLSTEMPIHIIKHDNNMGLSDTLKDGLMFAFSVANGNDAIITMDADNTHDPNYILRMNDELSRGSELVIASRYYGNGQQIGVPSERILLSKSVNYFLNCLTGLTVRDCTSGFRCYKASLLKTAYQKYKVQFISSKGFEIQVELLVKIGKISNKISEIPFTLRYDKKNGKSKMNLMKTIRNYAILSFKIISWRT